MSRPPPADFATAKLDIIDIQLSSFSRIYRAEPPNPLGFGKGPSRFADPRPLPPEDRFGVLHLGQNPEVGFVEAVLRDRAVGAISPFLLPQKDLAAWTLAGIASQTSLRLLDLRGSGMMRLRMPSDALRGADHTLGTQWSLAVHQHPDRVDGIVYNSRLNEMICVAVHDRAVPKLQCTSIVDLKSYVGLADILNKYRIALI